MLPTSAPSPFLGLATVALCWPAVAGAAAPQRIPQGLPQTAVWHSGNHGSWFAMIEDSCKWHEAKARCELAGGQLAVTPDAKTWEAVAKIVPRFNVWLGATDEVEEGKWVWVDGTPMKWNSWKRGEPNNYGGNEDALVSSWGDVPIDSERVKGYICQWKSFDGLMAVRFDVEDQNAEVGDILKKFRQQVRAVARDPHAAAIKAADAAYLAALTKEKDLVAKRGELDQALAFQREIDLVNSGQLVSLEQDPQTPKALLKLRKDHIDKCHFADAERSRKTAPLAQLCDSLLNKIQTKLVKDGMIEHAQQVKMLRALIVRLGV